MSKNGYLQNTSILRLTQGGGFYLSIVIQNIKQYSVFVSEIDSVFNCYSVMIWSRGAGHLKNKTHMH